MIAVAQIAQLAELYDRYNNALDPFSESCRAAKRQFEELAARLHSTHAPDMNVLNFRYELVRHCRDYLRNNPIR